MLHGLMVILPGRGTAMMRRGGEGMEVMVVVVVEVVVAIVVRACRRLPGQEVYLYVRDHPVTTVAMTDTEMEGFRCRLVGGTFQLRVGRRRWLARAASRGLEAPAPTRDRSSDRSTC